MKKTIVFDFGCVLVGLSKTQCTTALRRVGCGRIAHYVDDCKQEDLFHDLEVGGDIAAFCEEARQKSSYTDEGGRFRPCTATDEEICWAWNELLTGIPVEKLRMVRHIREDLGYRTVILSNTNRIHWDRSVRDFFTADGLTVEDYFDDILLSCDMQMVKPDHRIYETMLEKLGVPVSEVLFIDDSEKNCAAANACGIDTIHDPKGDRWMGYFRQLENMRQHAAIIGNFDGVHQGHLYVVQKLRELSRKYFLKPLVVTFDKHPRTIFDKSFRPHLLSTLEERCVLLNENGVTDIETIKFTEEFAQMSAYDFMKNVLRDKYNVSLLLLGYDNRFGKRNDTEDFSHYQRYGEELGIKVMLANPTDVDSVRVSSSHVRHLVEAGDMAKASVCLSRPYSLTGIVVPGRQEGRCIGYPTANIMPQDGKIIPANGVYATTVMIDGETYKAMTNIGCRPTFDDGQATTIETYIFNFNKEIYGKLLTLHFLRKIRDEIQFDTPQQLKAQLDIDRLYI